MAIITLVWSIVSVWPELSDKTRMCFHFYVRCLQARALSELSTIRAIGNGLSDLNLVEVRRFRQFINNIHTGYGALAAHSPTPYSRMIS